MLFELVVFPQATQWGLVIHWKSLQGSPALHSQLIWNAPFSKRGTPKLSPLKQSEQSPAVAAGMLAHPVSCVYVRNSDTAGSCLLHTLPKIQMAKTQTEICKGVQVCWKWGRKYPLAKGERQKTILYSLVQNLTVATSWEKQTSVVFLLPQGRAGLH